MAQQQQIDPRFVVPANHPMVQARRAICAKCPFKKAGSGAIGFLGALFADDNGQCDVCKCLLSAKTRVVRERCPKGYW